MNCTGLSDAAALATVLSILPAPSAALVNRCVAVNSFLSACVCLSAICFSLVTPAAVAAFELCPALIASKPIADFFARSALPFLILPIVDKTTF